MGQMLIQDSFVNGEFERLEFEKKFKFFFFLSNYHRIFDTKCPDFHMSTKFGKKKRLLQP